MKRIPVVAFVLAVMVQLIPFVGCYDSTKLPPCSGEPYPHPCDGRIDRAPKDAGQG